MRAIVIAGLAGLLAATPCAAEDKEQPAASAKAPPLALPVNSDDCFKTFEAVLQHALDADLLDDQIDEAELHLEKLEAACHDRKFPEALDEARAVVRIVASNK